MARERTASPAPSRKTESPEFDGGAGPLSLSFVSQPRPKGLRESLLSLHIVLGCVVLFFVWVGESMVHVIPDGHYMLKNGTFIDINSFDVVDLGPFPKCHPRYGEHQVSDNDTVSWVKNTDVPSGGPFPVGHPENPEWIKKADHEAKKEAVNNRFTWQGLQPNLHLLSLAVLCVLLGSKHAVWLFTEPVETREEAPRLIQKEDAYWFPIVGSCTLFSLFVLYKYFGTEWIKLAISCGIVLVCIFGVGSNLGQLIAVVRSNPLPPRNIPSVYSAELIGCVLGLAMAGGFLVTKHWIINNIFGVSFCLLGIKMIGIASYRTGAIMLIGLFFYDIFWVFGSKSVFGSNVMVTVAKGVEAPIKLMFPRFLHGCGTLQHSMLGLGDIVVPGIFIAFLAKWDAIKMGEQKSTSFVYLNVTMAAYTLSLVTTIGIMLFFNHAQPALLYIVPFVLFASFSVAVVRGEVKAILSFDLPEEPIKEVTSESAEKKES